MGMCPRCLKITEKVAFNIASEASYVYISCQKLIKKAKKKVHFGEFFKTSRLSISASFLKPQDCGQNLLPDRSLLSFNRTKIVGKCQKIDLSHVRLASPQNESIIKLCLA